jgi:hypothetical protein
MNTAKSALVERKSQFSANQGWLNIYDSTKEAAYGFNSYVAATYCMYEHTKKAKHLPYVILFLRVIHQDCSYSWWYAKQRRFLSLWSSQEVPMLRLALQRRTLPKTSTKLYLNNFDIRHPRWRIDHKHIFLFYTTKTVSWKPHMGFPAYSFCYGLNMAPLWAEPSCQ